MAQIELGKEIELNPRVVEKTVKCPHCGFSLACWGYMINGTINCRCCKESFILDQALWESSYTRLTNYCNKCQTETYQGIHGHFEHGLKLICLVCNEITELKIDGKWAHGCGVKMSEFDPNDICYSCRTVDGKGPKAVNQCIVCGKPLCTKCTFWALGEPLCCQH